MTAVARAAEPALGPDETLGAELRRQFNRGLTEAHLAELFDLPVREVRRLLGPSAVRGKSMPEFWRETKPLPPSRVAEVTVEFPYESLNRPLERGEQMPKFANHDGHVAAVLAAGGFSAFSERPCAGGKAVCLPLIRAVRPQGQAPKRRKSRGVGR